MISITTDVECFICKSNGMSVKGEVNIPLNRNGEVIWKNICTECFKEAYENAKRRKAENV